jgi:hypothetical protein
LLEARAVTFGPEMECQLACPGCNGSLELALPVADLLEANPPLVDGATGTDVVREAGWQVTFRLPVIEDLLDAERLDNPAASRRAVLSRCVVAAQPPGEQETAGLPEGGIPQAVEAALLSEMQRRDPTSNVDVSLNCPACGHSWTASFDILSFFWDEIEVWVYRTLREVHLLASSYGWREADVLGLTSWRRQAYLQMAGSA